MEPCIVRILHSADYFNFWILLRTIQGITVYEKRTGLENFTFIFYWCKSTRLYMEKELVLKRQLPLFYIYIGFPVI